MSEGQQKIPTSDLQVGMYVSKLDRPWLETPFLFQGFTIKTPAEIEELRRYCEYVYVDKVGRASESDTDKPGAAQPATERDAQNRQSRQTSDRQTSLFARLVKRFAKEPKEQPEPGDFYTDTVSVRVELPEARQAHDRASSVLYDAMENIRSGGKLDVRVLESVVDPMVESLLRNRDAMTWLSRLKQTDDYTYGHSVSCSIYAMAFGRHLGLPKDDLKVLGLGGLLLDVGKTRIPKQLLGKPGRLTDEELAMVRQHVAFGREIVMEAGTTDERVVMMVYSHHERYDGSGYPDGLKGPDIPVFARIAGIIDIYDAMTTPRSYAHPISAFDAIRELHRQAGTTLQAEMVHQFVQAVGVFPNGALVELSNGEVGIVVEQNKLRRLRPKVMVILGGDKEPLDDFPTIDLRTRPAEPNEKDAVWIDRGLADGSYGIDPTEYYL